MTLLVPSFDDALVVREADAEVLGMAQLSTRLLADSDATGGALSVMRTTMGEDIEGARPHTHSKSAELFYILEGQLQLLAGSQVITAGKGDLVVVPPNMAHAALDQNTVEALRTLFQEDLLARSPFSSSGGLFDLSFDLITGSPSLCVNRKGPKREP